MKKSNKLLIVLFCFVIISLILFNALLNVQLKANHLTTEYKPTTRSKVALKQFQHVVYDGRFYLHESVKNQMSWLDRVIHLSVGERDKYELEMPSNLEEHILYHYQGDTLFISLKKQDKLTGRDNYVPEGKIKLHLFAPALSSVSSVGGAMTIDKVRQQTPLTLNLKNSDNFVLIDMDLPMLQLRTDSNAQVMLINQKKVDTLALTMGRRTGLTLLKPNNIKTILPLQLDSTARIRVDGTAEDMKEYLQKTQ